MFREVVLVDLIHPFASRWATRKLHNVKRVEADVTGTIERAYAVAWDAHLPLPRSEPTLYLDDPEVDFTASVNLLSQLPCMPMAYLQRQHVHPQEKIDEYARDVIRAHLVYLDRLPGRVALVTDFERLKITLLGQSWSGRTCSSATRGRRGARSGSGSWPRARRPTRATTTTAG